jgi:predicted nucleotidyltransferase
MVSEEIILKAVDLLREAAQPERIILFGSYARGNASETSDVDLLVIEQEVKNRHAELVRLSRIMAQLAAPIEVFVVSTKDVEEWGHLPGTALRPALKEGKVMYDAA